MCSGQGPSRGLGHLEVDHLVLGRQLLAVSLTGLSPRSSGGLHRGRGLSWGDRACPMRPVRSPIAAPLEAPAPSWGRQQRWREAAPSCTWRLEGWEEASGSGLGWGAQELSLPL